MFYVDAKELNPNSHKLRGWFPTKELAQAHVDSWPRFIKEGMTITPDRLIVGVKEPRRGTPPEHLSKYVAAMLNDHIAGQARMVSHAEDAYRYKPTEPEMVADEWRPWDTAPRDGTYFDAWVEPIRRGEKARRIPNAQFCKTLGEFWAMEFGTTDEIEALGKPTHWRPEPEGPKK